jgi:NADH-quinone oxidoreductase subunit J
MNNLTLINLIFACLASGSGLYILFTNNILNAAYALLVCLLSVAALFVTANAEFIAASQIIIYVGGILIILIFGIVLSRNANNKPVVEAKETIMKSGLVFLSIMALFLSFLSLMKVTLAKPFAKVSIKEIGFQILGSSVFLLEFIGFILLMALIAATYILKNDE